VALAASAALLALLAAGAPRPAGAACAFKQNCTGAGCHPWPVDPGNANETTPFANPGRACPQYKDAGCCTVQQDLLLYMNLRQIQAQFGVVQGGGCPGCFYNLRNFWCEYTCSPRQADFVRVLGVSNMEDPTQPGHFYDVLRTRVALQRDFACGVFDSCERVKPVQIVSAMNSAEGFFDYQGETEAVQHGAYIEFDLDAPANAAATPMAVPLCERCRLTEASGKPAHPRAPALARPLTALRASDARAASPPHADSCCSFPAVDPAGPPWAPSSNSTLNASCPCAFCKGMCAGGQCGGGSGGGGGGSGDGSAYYGADLPWWNGLNPVVIGAVWGAVLAFAVAHAAAHWVRRHK
jgi:hypothetical protein